jgi:hypothetical protein
VDGPLWLNTHGLHAYLLGHDPRDAEESQLAARHYAALVEAGRHVDLWGDALRQQIYLGDESFVGRMQALTAPTRRTAAEVPKAQRQTKLALKDLLAHPDSTQSAGIASQPRLKSNGINHLASRPGKLRSGKILGYRWWQYSR